MTVAEMIEKLEEFPPELEVSLKLKDSKQKYKSSNLTIQRIPFEKWIEIIGE